MPAFCTLQEIAYRVDELLLAPENMAAARQLAEGYLADAEEGNVDCFQFPTDPKDPYDWTPASIQRERGLEEFAVLTPRQIVVALAALHDINCPNVEKVVAIPTELPPLCEGTSDWRRVLRYMAIRDTVRKLGDHTLPWFTLLLRRFELLLPKQTLANLWAKDTASSPDGEPATETTDVPLGWSLRPARGRTGRPRKGESDKEQLVISALVAHHKWQPGGSVGNDSPSKTKGLAELASGKAVKVSVATVSRFFQRKFPGLGYKGYVSACAQGRIGVLLTLWQGDVSEKLADLRPEEYGRGDDD